jgi:hypothetical protein
MAMTYSLLSKHILEDVVSSQLIPIICFKGNTSIYTTPLAIVSFCVNLRDELIEFLSNYDDIYYIEYESDKEYLVHDFIDNLNKSPYSRFLEEDVQRILNEILGEHFYIPSTINYLSIRSLNDILFQRKLIWMGNLIPYNLEIILFFFGIDVSKFDIFEKFGKYTEYFYMLLENLRTGNACINKIEEILKFIEFITYFCLSRARAYIIPLTDCISGGIFLKILSDKMGMEHQYYISQYINIQSLSYSDLMDFLTFMLFEIKDSIPIIQNIIKCRYMDINMLILELVLVHFDIIVNPNRLSDLSIAIGVWDKILLDEWKYIFLHNFMLRHEVTGDSHDMVSEILGEKEMIEEHIKYAEENEFLRHSLTQIFSLINWRNMSIPKLSDLNKPHRANMDFAQILEFEGKVMEMLTAAYLQDYNINYIFLIHSFENPSDFHLGLLDLFNGIGSREVSSKRDIKCSLALHYILTKHGNTFDYATIKHYIEENDLIFLFFLIYILKTRGLDKTRRLMNKIQIRYIRKANYKIFSKYLRKICFFMEISEDPILNLEFYPDTGYAYNSFEEEFIYDMYFRWKGNDLKMYENDILAEHFNQYYQDITKS